MLGALGRIALRPLDEARVQVPAHRGGGQAKDSQWGPIPQDLRGAEAGRLIVVALGQTLRGEAGRLIVVALGQTLRGEAGRLSRGFEPRSRVRDALAQLRRRDARGGRAGLLHVGREAQLLEGRHHAQPL
eukprot:3512023-Prymnesium_polylepis.1